MNIWESLFDIRLFNAADSSRDISVTIYRLVGLAGFIIKLRIKTETDEFCQIELAESVIGL